MVSDPFELTIAHSPDSDDAFMFFALAQNRIPTHGIRVKHLLADIQTLNEQALVGRHEITAVSIHAYAFIHDRYALATCGGSVGDGYGPLVVARSPLSLDHMSRTCVAIPGELTTAALVLKLFFPGVRCTVLPFDRILEEVESGRIEAGLIIHEGQLTFASRGLVSIIDLGAEWKRRTGLPLPLGANAVRKDLGPIRMRRVVGLMKASIEYGLAHRTQGLDHARSYARGLALDQIDRFVGMYVNDATLDFGPLGRQAIARLLDDAYQAGIIPHPAIPEFIEPMTD